jgi:hypothetical protein
MDSSAIAASFAVTAQAQTQQSLQTEMMKMAAAQDASLVTLLQQGAENLQSAQQAAPPAGMGGSLDVTV